MNQFNLKLGARWLSASALCSVFVLSTGNALAQNDFQQVVTTNAVGNKAFLDVNGKRLQQSLDSLFLWVNELETVTSTPADPDTVYNYLNTLTVQQGGFQANSDGGTMGITDLDIDGSPMTVVFGAADANIDASMVNMELGAFDVGWNSTDLNLVGGNNPFYTGASPDQILELFFAGDENTDPGNVRSFLDSAEVGQFAFTADLDGTVEGDQILWAQDSLLFLGKDIVSEASSNITVQAFDEINLMADDGDNVSRINMYNQSWGPGVDFYAEQVWFFKPDWTGSELHTGDLYSDGDISADGEISMGPNESYLNLASNTTETWEYGAPDENGHAVMHALGGMNLTVDHQAGIEMAYDEDLDEVNMDQYAYDFRVHSGNEINLNVDGVKSSTLELGLDLDAVKSYVRANGDSIYFNGYGVVDTYSFNKVHSEVSDEGDQPAYLDIAWANSTDPWLYGGSTENGHIAMNANGAMNLTVKQKAGMEMAYDADQDVANVDLYGHDIDLHAIDGDLNLAAQGNANVQAADFNVTTSNSISLDLDGDGSSTLELGLDYDAQQSYIDLNSMAINMTGTNEVNVNSYDNIHSEVNKTGPISAPAYLDIDWANSTDPWLYGGPTQNGHIAMNANGAMNLTVKQKAGMEIAYDVDSDVANVDLYGHEIDLHSLDASGNQISYLHMGYDNFNQSSYTNLGSGSFNVTADNSAGLRVNEEALKVSLYESSDLAFSEGYGYWNYSDPDQNYWDAAMPVVEIKSSDDIAIYSENTGGLELCRDCGTVSLFSNSEITVDAIDGDLNLKSGTIINTVAPNHSVVVTNDAGIQAGDDIFFMASGDVNVYGNGRIHNEVPGTDQAYLDIAEVNATDNWDFAQPGANGHIVMNAKGGMNLTVAHHAGIEMVYDEGIASGTMDFYANEFTFNNGPIIAPEVRTDYLRINLTQDGPPADVSPGTIFLDPTLGLVVYFDGQYFTIDLTPAP